MSGAGFDFDAVVAGDYGGGALADVVFGAPERPRLALFENDGAGGLRVVDELEFELEGGVRALTAADVNLDGNLDAVASLEEADRVAVALGNGQQGLVEGPTVAVDAPGVLRVRELDGDGLPDLVVAGERTVWVLAGLGGGSFDPEPLETIDTGTRAAALLVFDFSGDGGDDLVLALPELNSVRLYRGEGDGTFTPAGVRAASTPSSLAVGDFNGDGRPDLAVAEAEGISVFLGSAAGLAAQPIRTAGPAARGLQRADLNGDGFADLSGLDAAGAAVVPWVGRGDGSFEVFEGSAIEAAGRAVTLFDLDGNRLPDTVVAALAEIAVGRNDTPVRFIVGDVDRNGVVNAADLNALFREFFDGDGADADSCGGGTLASDAGADVNGDHAIDAADVPALVDLL